MALRPSLSPRVRKRISNGLFGARLRHNFNLRALIFLIILASPAVLLSGCNENVSEPNESVTNDLVPDDSVLIIVLTTRYTIHEQEGPGPFEVCDPLMEWERKGTDYHVPSGDLEKAQRNNTMFLRDGTGSVWFNWQGCSGRAVTVVGDGYKENEVFTVELRDGEARLGGASWMGPGNKTSLTMSGTESRLIDPRYDENETTLHYSVDVTLENLGRVPGDRLKAR